MTLISCVWNFATVRRPHCPTVNWNGLTDSSEWLYQTRCNSSKISLKRTSSQRSVTSSHAWAQDLSLKEDSENDVLNSLNPVLLRLQNTLVVRSHMKVVIVFLLHWPCSIKKHRIALGLIRFPTKMNVWRFTSNKKMNYLNHRVMVGWVELLRTTCP